MESLEHAMKRDAPILAEYLGGAVNSDAHHMTDPRPDGSGVSTCIKRSLEDAGVAPEEVTIECFTIYTPKLNRCDACIYMHNCLHCRSIT
jgi:3-oxoacyl-[acyl-carrier-protein] synthase II